MITTSRQQLIGARGEKIAQAFLQARGFKLVAQNLWLARLGEIDFVAEKSGVLHFIEIKTLRQPSAFRPEHHFNQSKRRKLTKLISFYLNRHRLECDYQLDLIAIELNDSAEPGAKTKIRFYQNV